MSARIIPTDREFLELGRHVLANYVRPMSIRQTDGSTRPLTNLEMAAALELSRDDRMLDRDADRFAITLQSWLSSDCPIDPSFLEAS